MSFKSWKVILPFFWVLHSQIWACLRHQLICMSQFVMNWIAIAYACMAKTLYIHVGIHLILNVLNFLYHQIKCSENFDLLNACLWEHLAKAWLIMIINISFPQNKQIIRGKQLFKQLILLHLTKKFNIE